MLPYILLAILPLCLVIFYRGLEFDNKQKRNYLIFVGIFLFLFLALRNKNLGSTDTRYYYSLMEQAIGISNWNDFYDPDGVEKGFQNFTFVLSRIFTHPQWIIVITALIYTISIGYFVYHNSPDAPLSIVMYISLGMLTFEMQGMRQAIAMSICLFAYEFAKKKKFIWFLLLVLFATLFHQTAIVFLVIYILMILRYRLLNLVFLVFGGILTMLFADELVVFANDLFDMSYHGLFEEGGFVATAIYIIIIVTALWLNKKLPENGSDTKAFYVALVGLVCYIMRYVGVAIAERISFYFMFSQIAVLPSTLVNLPEKDKRAVRTLALILTVALFAYRLHDSNLVPYKFYWQ